MPDENSFIVAQHLYRNTVIATKLSFIYAIHENYTIAEIIEEGEGILSLSLFSSVQI
jgi:hypothetical protein